MLLGTRGLTTENSATFLQFFTEHFSSRWLLIVLHFTQFVCYFYKFLLKKNIPNADGDEM